MDKPKMSGQELIDGMNQFQLSRWLALFEAINIIADKAEDNGKTVSYACLKKPPLEEYVDITSTIIYRAMTGRGIEEHDNARR